MSGRRRGPVRQLSLPQSARRPLRRQVSEDCGLRVLASALVLPAPQAPRPRREVTPVRARPVRVAWTERRQGSVDEVPPGVVVQRCKGLPRPVTAKPAPRSPAPPDTILYSRQQLAERLRQAWKDRQRRPNLDIFLAHNSVARGDDDCQLSVREIVTEVEKNTINYNKHDNNDLRFSPFRENSDLPCDGPGFILSGVPTFPTATFPLAAFHESSDSDRDRDCNNLNVKSAPLKLTPSITISFDHREDSEAGTNENEPDDGPPVSVLQEEVTGSDHLLRPDSYPVDVTRSEQPSEEEAGGRRSEVSKETDRPKTGSTLTAMMRRANFRNSANNVTISGSTPGPSSPTPTTTPSPTPTPSPTVRPILKKPAAPTLTRMMSAPAAARRAPLARDVSVTREPSNEGLELEHDEEDLTIVQRERNIKSAPARRRFKSGRRKGPKGHEDDSSDEEPSTDDGPAATKPKPRKRFVERGVDIVTMVSLLSPAESEADEAEPPIQLVPESWSKPDPKEPEPAPLASPLIPPPSASALVCLRKFPAKAVSFQQSGGAPSRSYTASFPSRRGAATPLVVFPPSSPPSIAPPPPPPPPLRRRQPLVRAKTLGQESSSEADIPPEPPEVLPPPPDPVVVQPLLCPRPSPDPPDENKPDPDAEPTFQTPKERECWQMFRKMADKGITVSYDTVLRGMLTPTEYRLHKKSMSSAC